MALEKNEIVELDELLSELRGNAKLLAKDLIAGVEMVRTASLLVILLGGLFALFAMFDLFLLPLYQGAPCCWVLTNYDLVGGLASIAGVKATEPRRWSW